MPDFKFALGQVVIVSPIPDSDGQKGLVTGQVNGLSGIGYLVSCAGFGANPIVQHLLAECEIQECPPE